jgi:hypothetical protein
MKIHHARLDGAVVRSRLVQATVSKAQYYLSSKEDLDTRSIAASCAQVFFVCWIWSCFCYYCNFLARLLLYDSLHGLAWVAILSTLAA